VEKAMRKAAFIAAVVVMMLLTNKTKAGVSEIRNGSFEEDGLIYDITIEAPNNWDVNVPLDNFGGWVYDDWVTDGSYNLTIYSSAYEAFEVNDIATVSQEVYLTDVNEILFDLRLDTQSASKIWDPTKRTAFLMIDDVPIWESNDVGLDVRGEYRNQVANICVDDFGLHRLSLGLRADVNETTTNITYYTDWDFVRFNVHCGGFGFLAGDFSRDCYVDECDLKMLAENWLDEIDPYSKYNLFHIGEMDPYGTINFLDFAIFADSWDGNMLDLKMFTEVWLQKVDLNHEYNLFHGDDVYPKGVIDFLDFTIFAENWLRSSYEQGQ
jgi:hypothetical protein